MNSLRGAGGTSLSLDPLDVFAQQWAWIRGQVDWLRTLKLTPKHRRMLNELSRRNDQLRRDVDRLTAGQPLD